MKMKENQSEGTIRLHNVRFYNLPPRAINCLSYNRQSAKLALSREGGTVEIWDMSYAAFLEKQIPDAKSSIECLGWAGNRLFSGGLSGEIVEWDLVALKRKPLKSVTGMAIWCLDIDRAGNSMIVGTEAGYLNAFDIDESGIAYKNLFDKQDGRILSCKFDSTGEFVATGSIDVIRIWNAETGHVIHKMTLARSESNAETIVWSLQILKDFTIIAGDSRGHLTIWDGKLGAQIEDQKAARADILAVAINDEEDILICSGIDPLIRIYSLTEIKKSDRKVKKWVKFHQRNAHAHDVKALVCTGNYVVSGGIDSYLGISSFAKTTMESTIVKHGPFLQSPCVSIAPIKRQILLQYVTTLEIWNLGTASNRVELSPDECAESDGEATEKKEEKTILLLDKVPRKLVQLQSVHDDAIVCSALSPSGQYLAYSTANAIRIFVIKMVNNQSTLTRIKDISESFSPCSKMLFSHDSKNLFLVHAGVNHINVFDIRSKFEIDHFQTIDVSRAIKDVIHLLTISPCGKYLVLASTCRKISVWMLTNKQWAHYFDLPRYPAPTTALAMHTNRLRIVATFTDGKIFDYDLHELRFTCSSNKHFLSTCKTHCVSNIVLCEQNDDIFILHNDSGMFVLQKVKEKRRLDSNKQAKTEGEITPSLQMRYSKPFEHFLYLARLSKNELVMVEVNPVSLMERLPSAMKQKLFGCM